MEAVEQGAWTANADRYAGVAGAWLMSLRSDRTRTGYRRDLLDYFRFIDRIPIDAMKAGRRHVDAWRLTLTGAPSTIARKLAAVSSFYRYAASDGVTDDNPAAHVARPRIDADHSSTQGLTRQQALDLIATARADGARPYALIAVLLITGCRISEALGANRDDLQHDAGHRVLVVTRKGGKRQKIVLTALAIDALAQLLGEAAAHGTEITVAGADDDTPIFTTRTGRRWESSEAFRTVQRLARRAGIPGQISPHSLRHAHATLALDAGQSLADLQDSLGHADPRTTRRYDRARGRLERSSSYAVAGALA